MKDNFVDTMDTINKIAKRHNWINGLEWANFAVQFSLITEKQFIEYEKLHELRNSMSHGNSKNITVSPESYYFAKTFLAICEKKMRDNKFPKGKSNKISNHNQHAQPRTRPNIRKIYVITSIKGTYFEKYVTSHSFDFDNNFTNDISKAMQFNNRSEAINCLTILQCKTYLFCDHFIKEISVD